MSFYDRNWRKDRKEIFYPTVLRVCKKTGDWYDAYGNPPIKIDKGDIEQFMKTNQSVYTGDYNNPGQEKEFWNYADRPIVTAADKKRMDTEIELSKQRSSFTTEQLDDLESDHHRRQEHQYWIDNQIELQMEYDRTH